MADSDRFQLSTIPEIIDEAKQGKMFILVDDENRENEGDLIIPAQHCDDKQVNFMAKYGRGLICLALDENRVKELDLPLMSLNNESRHKTAFTISIEAKAGISTGISAQDRAKTIADAINPQKTKNDLVSPGHIFPLRASNGGVLVRAGHTEAAVDIAKMADLNPAGVICEIMNDDGSMARLPDLIKFAQTHNMKIGTIADLIEYRRQHEKLIEAIKKDKFNTNYGQFDITIYRSTIDNVEHIALTQGNLKEQSDKEILVRMHHLNILSDCLNDQKNPKTGNLEKSLEIIANHGRGAIVIIRQPDESIAGLFFNDQKANLQQQSTLRNYGIGAQILNDLGIKNMTLISNAKKSVIGLDAYDIKIAGYRDI